MYFVNTLLCSFNLKVQFKSTQSPLLIHMLHRFIHHNTGYVSKTTTSLLMSRMHELNNENLVYLLSCIVFLINK